MVGERNKNAFNEAVRLCQPGDKIIYHVGLFAGGHFKADAMDAYRAGKVTLYTKRLSHQGGNRFQYIAERVEKKK